MVLARIVSRLEECFCIFEKSGFGPLREDYLRRWLHTGQRVEAQDPLIMTPQAVVGAPDIIAGGPSVSNATPPFTTSVPSSTPHSLVSSSVSVGKGTMLTIRGLSPSGFLLAVDDQGQKFELSPDGNRLDMMAGLLKRKL